jgi:hypothetical protein
MKIDFSAAPSRSPLSTVANNLTKRQQTTVLNNGKIALTLMLSFAQQ